MADPSLEGSPTLPPSPSGKETGGEGFLVSSLSLFSKTAQGSAKRDQGFLLVPPAAYNSGPSPSA